MDRTISALIPGFLLLLAGEIFLGGLWLMLQSPEQTMTLSVTVKTQRSKEAKPVAKEQGGMAAMQPPVNPPNAFRIPDADDDPRVEWQRIWGE
jgi:hypothetical protein